MIQRNLKTLLMILCVGIAGCTTVTPIVGPDGTENQLISCGAVESCYKKAIEICHGPSIVDRRLKAIACK